MLRSQMKRILGGRRAGFTLVESMIALGLIGVIVLAVMQFISQSSDVGLYNEALNARMSLGQTMTRAISNFDDVTRSAKASNSPGNMQLRYCLGLAPGTCSTTSAASPASFDLYAVKGAVKIAGTAGQSVTYSRTGGTNCVPGPNCPFWQARAYFYASCPNNSVTCDKASTINVKFDIQPANSEYNNRRLKGQQLTVAHRVFKSAIKDSQDCPDGSEQIGLSKDGLVQCRCRPGYTQTGLTAEGQPVCQGAGVVHCNKNEILKGRNPDGSPYCVPVVRKCGTVNFGSTDATCPNAGWLENINLGYCKPVGKKGKKTTSRDIKCDTNQGYCCWYEEK